jgi:hypothetical protein
MNQSQHMLMNERIGQFNSGYPANYFQCSYAAPYIAEKEVTTICSIPYASHNFHDSVPYFSNDYSQINENSSNIHTYPHATIAYTLPTTSAPCVAKIHNRINGISTNIHITTSSTSHTSYEQNFGITSSSLPNSYTSNLQHCVSQTCTTLPRSKPISTWEKCLDVFKVDFDRNVKKS